MDTPAEPNPSHFTEEQRAEILALARQVAVKEIGDFLHHLAEGLRAGAPSAASRRPGGHR